MRKDLDGKRLPRIVVGESDHDRLTSLAHLALDSQSDAAEALLAEMERAVVVPDRKLSAKTVRMGSTLAYRADEGEPRRVTLVFPKEADIAAGKVSVLTPIGAALIGLAEGQSILWTARDGRQHRLTVEAVEPVAAPA
ncbi:nucleoside diphosphate kinase regulator [Faunimonas sp. B44]|uniref:nucleoside diphosphate kinase regulator n=1 Tax=Faunimonas sp. B44 TaxID=3461493 RepID=UPI004044F4F2